jgi:hypothetical protein
MIFDRAGDQLGHFLPRLGGALLLLVVGLLVAVLFGRLVRGALVRVGLDRVAERTGTRELLERVMEGERLKLTRAVQDAARADHIVLTLHTPSHVHIEIDI